MQVLALAVLAGCGGPPSEPPPAPQALEEPAVVAPVEAPVRPRPADEVVEQAINRALQLQMQWLSPPPVPPHNDAKVGAHALDALLHTPASAALVELTTAQVSGSDPLQRLWDPELSLEPAMTTTWTPPQSGKRANPNRLLVEAAYCDDNGWRSSSTDYACGPMRDDGGFYTAHAVWALSIAVERGCVEPATTCLDDLADELLDAAARDGAPTSTIDADLLAERVLFATLAGADATRTTAAVHRLLEAQNDEGGFGTPVSDEPPYYRYHAAMAGAWALAAWKHHR